VNSNLDAQNRVSEASLKTNLKCTLTL